MTKETSNKKNWKGKVAKQWKRMHAGSSPAQGTTYPEGGSIGMFFHDKPLEQELGRAGWWQCLKAVSVLSWKMLPDQKIVFFTSKFYRFVTEFLVRILPQF